MIRTEFWPAWPEAGQSWVAINTVLEARERELPEHARVDESNDNVQVVCALWLNLPVDATDVAIDLGQLCERVTVTPEAITVDRNSMYRLLGEFYGEVPKLVALS